MNLPPMSKDISAQAEAERIKKTSRDFWSQGAVKRYIKLNELRKELHAIESKGGANEPLQQEVDGAAIELIGMLYGLGVIDFDQLIYRLIAKQEEA